MSQWNFLLKNIGEWQGSFTRFDRNGHLLSDVPTIVTLAGINDNKTIHQIVKKIQPDGTSEDLVLEYSSLGKGVLFLPNGAFSQGSIQWGPFSEFGAELGLIDHDRRLRLVELYDKESKLSQITLIREKLAGSDRPENPPLTINQLLGNWQGQAITMYPDWRTPTEYKSQLNLTLNNDDQLEQTLSFGTENSREIKSLGTIEGQRITFDSGVQILMLADGSSATFYPQITGGKSFFLEVGWLINPHLRHRLIRTYSDRGEWMSLTLVIEEKISVN